MTPAVRVRGSTVSLIRENRAGHSMSTSPVRSPHRRLYVHHLAQPRHHGARFPGQLETRREQRERPADGNLGDDLGHIHAVGFHQDLALGGELRQLDTHRGDTAGDRRDDGGAAQVPPGRFQLGLELVSRRFLHRALGRDQLGGVSQVLHRLLARQDRALVPVRVGLRHGAAA